MIYGIKNSKKILENEKTKTWYLKLKPKEKEIFHYHEYDFVVIPLVGDKIKEIQKNGREKIHKVKTGEVIFVQKGLSHWTLNIGKLIYKEIWIDLKRKKK